MTMVAPESTDPPAMRATVRADRLRYLTGAHLADGSGRQ